LRTSVLGLTGGIATGKSTAVRFLESQQDIHIVDADRVAREVVGRGKYAYRKIVETFGPGITHAETGEINRQALGSIVFSDHAKKRKLESITHPAILLEMVKQIVVNRMLGRRVVIDVPLLFEWKTAPVLYLLCFETLLIDVDEAEQIKRLRRRNPELSGTEIQNRIKSQLPREQKIAIADYVVNNQGSMEELEHQLMVLLA
jgi:dephospho-CoA kinase